MKTKFNCFQTDRHNTFYMHRLRRFPPTLSSCEFVKRPTQGGTFFWFRNRDAFATTKWRDVWQPTGWGAEAWPGRMFDFDQSACVAYDGLAECYDPESYDPQLEDEIDE